MPDEDPEITAQVAATAELAKAMEPTLPAALPDPFKASDDPGEKQPGDDKPAGGDGDDAAKGEDKDKAEASKDGEEPGGEGTEGKDREKPVAPQTVEDLLKDPKLGPSIQSWADKGAQAQVRAVEGRVQAAGEQAAEQANMEQWVNYFAQYNKEELAQVLAESPEAAQAYGAVQHYQANRRQGVDGQEVQTAAQVYSIGHQITTYNKMLAGSDLPQDQKEALNPEKFVHLGASGINTWGEAVHAALLKHEVAKAVKTEMDTRWEAVKQERLAELEKEHPGAAGSAGSPGAPGMDLLGTPDEVLLEAAFRTKPGGK